MFTLKSKAFGRLLLVGFVDAEQSKGVSLSELSRLMKLQDRINLTDDERKLLNVRVEEGQVRWNVKKDGKEDGEDVDILKEIELTDEQKELLYNIFKSKDEAKTFTKDGLTFVLDIADQLGYRIAG